jgi:hypothetical protein
MILIMFSTIENNTVTILNLDWTEMMWCLLIKSLIKIPSNISWSFQNIIQLLSLLCCVVLSIFLKFDMNHWHFRDFILYFILFWRLSFVIICVIMCQTRVDKNLLIRNMLFPDCKFSFLQSENSLEKILKKKHFFKSLIELLKLKKI